MTRTASPKHALLRTFTLTLILLVAVFVFAAVTGDNPAFAAAKPKLTKTKVTFHGPADTVTLKVKNVH